MAYFNELLFDVLNKTYYISFFAAVGAIGASKNLRRFGQSIKRVAREVKEAETPGKVTVKYTYWDRKT